MIRYRHNAGGLIVVYACDRCGAQAAAEAAQARGSSGCSGARVHFPPAGWARRSAMRRGVRRELILCPACAASDADGQQTHQQETNR